jgi:hypothetical protein
MHRFGVTTLSITTFSITALSIITFSIIVHKMHNDTQEKKSLAHKYQIRVEVTASDEHTSLLLMKLIAT